MQPFAVFAFSAILVSLCAVFLFLGKGIFAGNNQSGFNLPQPVIMTASAVILIGIFLGSLFIGREIIYADNVTSFSPKQAAEESVSAQNSPQELEDLANNVDQAADSVYNGLDTTKDIIGKTELRKEAIEHGRDHASGRLGTLSERIRKARQEKQPLRPFDRRTAEHVTKGVQ